MPIILLQERIRIYAANGSAKPTSARTQNRLEKRSRSGAGARVNIQKNPKTINLPRLTPQGYSA
jgi:hypothetical protein